MNFVEFWVTVFILTKDLLNLLFIFHLPEKSNIRALKDDKLNPKSMNMFLYKIVLQRNAEKPDLKWNFGPRIPSNLGFCPQFASTDYFSRCPDMFVRSVKYLFHIYHSLKYCS